MKKINATEAANIVGGCCKTCTDSYENVTTNGVISCKQVTTCKDKHGNVVSTTTKDAADSMCAPKMS